MRSVSVPTGPENHYYMPRRTVNESFLCLNFHMGWIIILKFWSHFIACLWSGFEDPPPSPLCPNAVCLSDGNPSIHLSFISVKKRSAQTRIRRLLSCVYGVVWLASLTSLTLVTQRTLLTAPVRIKCVWVFVGYAWDVGWCKCSTEWRNVLWGGKRRVFWAAVGVERVERE